ncbi:subtilisin-like protease 4 [Lycium ferocissimum]|uniref:subtilisin-like protease 4 n=1 Tax=Lycium ferocissimum TaxID=112874 RepID=UPI002814A0CF|nr:subtilisin-like protease 4 [Lycium ferocissimum]
MGQDEIFKITYTRKEKNADGTGRWVEPRAERTWDTALDLVIQDPVHETALDPTPYLSQELVDTQVHPSALLTRLPMRMIRRAMLRLTGYKAYLWGYYHTDCLRGYTDARLPSGLYRYAFALGATWSAFWANHACLNALFRQVARRIAPVGPAECQPVWWSKTKMNLNSQRTKHCFAARLTALEVKEIEKIHGFVSAQPQRILSLHTTHIPSFLGLQQNMGVWKDSNYGKGVIIGVIDIGIFPDHPSFCYVGMPPPPAKWKGVLCESNFTTKCNTKLIGATTYQLANRFLIDDDGHGTHTTGTVAGAFVKGANVYGNAYGSTVGLAPLAHIAIYNVCSDEGCKESNILAAMDAAIDDGVDILSISLSGSFNLPFYDDIIALGAYSATERGILVSCSAGNYGPSSNYVENTAPWILTVDASTVDRKLKATVKLGNGEKFEGESAYPKISNSTFFTLFDARKNASDEFETPYCKPGSLTDPGIRGKIVLCLEHGGVPRVDQW